MEDRLAVSRETRGVSLFGLAAIGAITAAWWTLALWPSGAAQPEWLARTRAACFGASRGGFPDAGGWVLLAGEPLGMAAMLWLMYGGALREDVRWIRTRPILRAVAAMLVATIVLVVGGTGVRAVRAWSSPPPSTRAIGRPVSTTLVVPTIALVDQNGRPVSLSGLAMPVVVTFAYGHCTTVCPVTVAALREARRARRSDRAIVVVTVDPWRDTPDRLSAIARSWSLGTDDFFLSGSVDDVSRLLDALGVGRRRNETNGEVDHAATAMLVRPGGRVAWRIDGPPAAFGALLTMN